MSLTAYLPIAVMFILVLGFAGFSLIASGLLAPKDPTPEKLEPYECGIVPLQEPVQRFPVKFYLVAMLFVIFDIEIVFLFAWASRFEQLGWYGAAAADLERSLELLPHDPSADAVRERLRRCDWASVKDDESPFSESPAALVRWATTGRQRTLVATVGTLAEEAEKATFKAPCVCVMGEIGRAHV